MMNRWIMTALIVVACLFGVYLLTTMPQKEREAGPSESFTVPDVAVDADAAMQTYKVSCIACHGADLQGKMGPALTKVGAEMSKERIYKQIAEGGGGMPGFESKLSENELVNLANWLAGHK